MVWDLHVALWVKKDTQRTSEDVSVCNVFYTEVGFPI